MQYILTEEEYKDLKAQATQLTLNKDLELLKFCRKVANQMPIKILDWQSRPVATWGCILLEPTFESEVRDWYCDHCPAQTVCPYPHKEWSK